MPESMRVLFFSDRFEVRGKSAYTLRLAEHLAAEHVTAHIVTPDARVIDPARRDDLSLTEYAHLTLPLWGYVVLEWVRRDAAKEPFDLIHIQSRNLLSQGAWLARKLRIPYVVTVHDYMRRGDRLRFDRTWGRRIIAVSESVRSDLLRNTRLPEELVTLIPGGVDVPPRESLTPVLDGSHLPVVGTAGPLESVKGIPYFLGAAQRVLQTHPDVQFLVGGAGPEESNLRRVARDLGIVERVTFAPNLRDFSTCLGAMDIFCLPSLRQGLGTIMLEAMALARPVIATGVGGVYSVVHHGETGLVVPPSDSARLAECILELLGDPHRARTLGDAGRRLVEEEFGAARMAAQTAELYRAVLEPAPSAAATV